jgi:hypothetical protein
LLDGLKPVDVDERVAKSVCVAFIIVAATIV